MASRTYTIHLTCIPGCRESSFSESSTRKDEQDARAWYAEHPWRLIVTARIELPGDPS